MEKLTPAMLTDRGICPTFIFNLFLDIVLKSEVLRTLWKREKSI